MGLFSSTVISVASSSLNLVEDTEGFVTQSVNSSILRGSNIADDLITNMQNTMATKVGGFYQYGKNHYTNGLPEGVIRYAKTNEYLVKKAIEESLGGTEVQVLGSLVDECNPDYFAYTFLINERGYDRETGVVSIHPFYLGNEEVTYRYADAIEGGGLTLFYSYPDTNQAGQPIETYVTEEISTVEVFPSELYYHAVYRLLSATGELIGDDLFWSYHVKDDTYPYLALEEGTQENVPYYPIVPVRLKNKDMTADDKKDTDLYKTSKRLLSKLDLNLDDLGEGVNGSPDIGQVDHAFVWMAVDIQSEKVATQRYLFEYFTYLNGVSKVSKKQYLNWVDLPTSPNAPPTNSITVKDPSFDLRINYNYITSEVITGNIGKVNTVTVESTTANPIRKSTLVGAGTSISYVRSDQSYLTLRKQITADSYVETIVHGLVSTNSIYRGRSVVLNIKDSLGEDTKLLIPINRGVARNLKALKENELYYDSLHITFNSYDEQKLKWYQTGFFQFVLLVIAIVITVLSYGSAIKSIGAAFAAGGYVAVAILIATNLAIAIAIKVAVDLAIEYLGEEFALIFAVLLIVYSTYTGFNTGSIEGAPWASEALSVSGAIGQGVQTSVAEDMQAISEELVALHSEYEALQKELDAANEDLTSTLSVNPLDYVQRQSLTNAYESPNEFFYRTIHVGNIGVACIDVISSYVDAALRLPEHDFTTI